MENFVEESHFKLMIGKNIRQFRENMNLTQSKLAELCQLHDNTIKNIESGNITPNIYTIYKISTVLNVPIDKLY